MIINSRRRTRHHSSRSLFLHGIYLRLYGRLFQRVLKILYGNLAMFGRSLLFKDRYGVLGISTIFLRRVLRMGTTRGTTIFLKGDVFMGVNYALTSRPLRFVVRHVEANLRDVRYHYVIRRYTLFYNRDITIHRVIYGSFLSHFQYDFQVSFTSSKRGGALPFAFLFSRSPMWCARLRAVSVNVLLFTTVFRRLIVEEIIFYAPISCFQLLVRRPEPTLRYKHAPNENATPCQP